MEEQMIVTKKSKRWIFQIPLVLILTLLPLITKRREYTSGFSGYDWYPYTAKTVDFFLYYKQWFFTGIAALLVMVLLIQKVVSKERYVFLKLFLPLALYSLLTLLSTIVSPFREWGISGSSEQFENVFCSMGYGIVCYYTFYFARSRQDLRRLINCYACGAILIGIIGTLQAFKFDPIMTDFGKRLITSSNFDINTLANTFEPGRVYITLYNPNYVGVYTAISIPLFIVLLVYAEKKYQYVLYELVILTNSFSMFGSKFKTGVICLFVTILIVVLMIRKDLKQRWHFLFLVASTLFMTFMLCNTLAHGSYINEIGNTRTGFQSVQVSLNDIVLGKDSVKVVYGHHTLDISMEDGNIVLADESGNPVNYQRSHIEGGVIMKPSEERFKNIIPGLPENWKAVDFCVIINDLTWGFTYDREKGKYQYVNQFNKKVDLVNAPSAVFTGYERLASGRGYIWSRTIPLLKDYIFWGAGADSFMQVFPQTDYVQAANFGYRDMLISKPHNLYLQVGVQSGVIALIMLLLFFLWYVLWSLKLYFFCEERTEGAVIGLAVFMGCIGFLISAIANDSTICVSPVFFTVLGIGIAANYIYEHCLDQELEPIEEILINESEEEENDRVE